jgi:hypothetical protein
MGALGGRGVLGLGQILDAVGLGLDQDDLAVGAHRAGHIEVERGFLSPTQIERGEVFLEALLVVFGEAAVGRRAGRQAVLGAIDVHVGLGVRIAPGVDDGHGGLRAALSGDVVGRGQVGRTVAPGRGVVLHRLEQGMSGAVGDDVGKAAGLAVGDQARANRDMIDIAGPLDRLGGRGERGRS